MMSLLLARALAGLMCAIYAGKRGRSVLLIDCAKAVGEKIRISGGGRCNFTNLHTTPANYLSNNPHFCVSALKRYTQFDFIELVKKHHIDYHEKTLGQLFCDGSSKQIIEMLIAECDAVGVQILLNTEVSSIVKQGSGFKIEYGGVSTSTESLVIATGGPSIPKMGATGWGYEIAKQFGLKVVEPRAGLVPFTLDQETLEDMDGLAGVSLEATVTCGKTSFREGMLFTHRGLSGPAVLQASSYWEEGSETGINFVPDKDVFAALKLLKQSVPKQKMQTALSQLLPKRLAQYLATEYAPTGWLADCSNDQLEEVANKVNNWRVTPNGTEGFRTAEVTLGGVDTHALSSKTFETKSVPGLYFIGEVVDVTGHLGGFNFQWAWSSGYAAGQYV